MHFGFALFKFFPFGGLQRDMLAIARACIERDHRVTVFCGKWEGERPDDIAVVEVPVAGLTNHARDRSFADALPAAVAASDIDRLVGFNKMPGLDVYYAADSCFAAKIYEERGAYYRFLPRARQYQRMEEAVFSPSAATQVLLISEPEKAVYQQYYNTPDNRLHLLPPGIRRDRIMPDHYNERRALLRKKFDWQDDETLVLFVGSGFRTKGLDRAIRAFSELKASRPKSRLLILGKDRAEKFVKLATQLGVSESVEFLGGVDAVSEYLWAGDVLLHPAYRENTGTVLLEAMVAGLPVITTDACGYARYVKEQDMGAVIERPFDQALLDTALKSIVEARAEPWRERGRHFAETSDIFSMPQRAAEFLEKAYD
ncbi:UDP-glucose:(heptosyl)LPS alpha-1,3-glucosyltransferase [Litorivivens lipolytica]|uniref:UDP-glucose:(Heptosyl)LPS alpha-1,3-glucosyltransferase n=2 Tax=Litorivivens lipolytica TaxID=1524264 RepID=A0A7W4W4K5_9GAMM|nr:UDP-glucose:(heptosyl)LPS alpha-1,3-glucosyltransferase [Litorivivens lipolytica]